MRSSSSLRVLLAPVALAPLAMAEYTVWASFIVANSGDHTPLNFVMNDTDIGVLTPLGAQQALSVGAFFRQRYLTPVSGSNGTGNGMSGSQAFMPGVDPYDNSRVYVEAMDAAYTVASASAFMQGLYPPALSNSSANGPTIEPMAVLANGSVLDAPLSGYKYPFVRTVSDSQLRAEDETLAIGRPDNCDAWTDAAYNSDAYSVMTQTARESAPFFQTLRNGLLADYTFPTTNYVTLSNAYEIYEYLNYQSIHNATMNSRLRQSIPPDSPYAIMQQLKWYADLVTWTRNGNLNAQNNYTQSTSNPWANGVLGSISTINGNYLANKVLAWLSSSLAYAGNGPPPLTVTYMDFRTMVSFFALSGLPEINSNFYGMPAAGSVMVFELFSISPNSSNATYPTTSDDLRVQVFFRNGTDLNTTELANHNYQSYPIFGNGPSSTILSWSDFSNEMQALSLSRPATWCNQCGSSQDFCAPWNSSLTSFGTLVPSSDPLSSLKPSAAAGIGFAVGFILLPIALGLAMLFGGVRFDRRAKSHKSDLGGFKGSSKLASDQDLTIPKGGATVGASIERPAGHERVGSWELKGTTGHGQPTMLQVPGDFATPRPSFESGFEGRQPVKPDERV